MRGGRSLPRKRSGLKGGVNERDWQCIFAVLWLDYSSAYFFVSSSSSRPRWAPQLWQVYFGRRPLGSRRGSVTPQQWHLSAEGRVQAPGGGRVTLQVLQRSKG